MRKTGPITILVVFVLLVTSYTSLLADRCMCEPPVVIEDESAIKSFFRLLGIECEGTWRPDKMDCQGIDGALKDYLDGRIRSTADAWALEGLRFIREHLEAYKKECCGIIIDKQEYIFCSMYLSVLSPEEAGASEAPGFTLIMDGGASVVRFIFDVLQKEVVGLEWNGEA